MDLPLEGICCAVQTALKCCVYPTIALEETIWEGRGCCQLRNKLYWNMSHRCSMPSYDVSRCRMVLYGASLIQCVAEGCVLCPLERRENAIWEWNIIMTTHSQTANGEGQDEIDEGFDAEFCDVCTCSAHLESRKLTSTPKATMTRYQFHHSRI